MSDSALTVIYLAGAALTAAGMLAWMRHADRQRPDWSSYLVGLWFAAGWPILVPWLAFSALGKGVGNLLNRLGDRR